MILQFRRVLNLKITLRASWVHSLKEKRMVVKSIVQRLKNKFNVSVGEVHEQDIHQIIVIGISAVCGDQKQVDSTLENLIDFVEENTDAEIINIESDNYIFK
ncbi:ylxp-like protein [Clostridium perfringens]|nr:ylxp-like protein [Clostridium perfringens]